MPLDFNTAISFSIESKNLYFYFSNSCTCIWSYCRCVYVKALNLIFLLINSIAIFGAHEILCSFMAAKSVNFANLVRCTLKISAAH